MASPVLMLAGTAGVGKSTIRTRLILGSSATPQQQQDGQEQRSSEPAAQLTHWDIDTKYYSARVQVDEICLQPTAAQPQVAQVEALVLIVDSWEESSFQAARAWAESSPAVMEAEIRLLIANKIDLLLQPPSGLACSQPQRPQWLLSAMDWCAASGFEYIEVCAADAELDAQLLLDGEEQGLSRVVQALQAHMWSGMQRKHFSRGTQEEQAPGVGPSLGISVDAGGRAEQQQDSGQCMLSQGQHDDAPVQPTAPAQEDTSSASATVGHGRSEPAETSRASSCSEAVTAAAEGPGGGPVPLAQEVPCSQINDDDDVKEREQEQEIESFEKIFMEIQGAKTRLAGLPDTERRSEAAAIAMRLASMLGLDSDEEEDSN